ncbi:hypothetical protein AAG570_007761 [Ranatra chinensis]|uniref:Peptidase M13 N-terminal domain-containing protein n=1 Tax=Ranatra chinensis TaxID=642074 RepID=A0ABD0XUQ2_9HEMI
MASKRRNMFQKNNRQETTENVKNSNISYPSLKVKPAFLINEPLLRHREHQGLWAPTSPPSLLSSPIPPKPSLPTPLPPTPPLPTPTQLPTITPCGRQARPVVLLDLGGHAIDGCQLDGVTLTTPRIAERNRKLHGTGSPRIHGPPTEEASEKNYHIYLNEPRPSFTQTLPVGVRSEVQFASSYQCERCSVRPTLADDQFGFRKERYSRSYLGLKKTLRKGQDTIIAFIDTEKAFHEVDRQQLFEGGARDMRHGLDQINAVIYGPEVLHYPLLPFPLPQAHVMMEEGHHNDAESMQAGERGRGILPEAGSWLCCLPCNWLKSNTSLHKASITAAMLLVTSLLVASPVLFLISGSPGAEKVDLCHPGEGCRQEDETCGTSACYEAALTIGNAISTAEDPCQDFYKYSCGSWAQQRPGLRQLQSQVDAEIQRKCFSIDREVKEAVEKRLAEVETEQLLETTAQSGPFEKVGRFYNSCIKNKHESSVNKTLSLLEELGGYMGVGESNLTTLISRLILMNGSPLFDLYLDKDLHNASQLAIYLDLPKPIGRTIKFFHSLPSQFNFEKYVFLFVNMIAVNFGALLQPGHQLFTLVEYSHLRKPLLHCLLHLLNVVKPFSHKDSFSSVQRCATINSPIGGAESGFWKGIFTMVCRLSLLVRWSEPVLAIFSGVDSFEEKQLLLMEELLLSFIPRSLNPEHKAKEIHNILLLTTMLSKIYPKTKDILFKRQNNGMYKAYTVMTLQDYYGFVIEATFDTTAFRRAALGAVAQSLTIVAL